MHCNVYPIFVKFVRLTHSNKELLTYLLTSGVDMQKLLQYISTVDIRAHVNNIDHAIVKDLRASPYKSVSTQSPALHSRFSLDLCNSGSEPEMIAGKTQNTHHR